MDIITPCHSTPRTPIRFSNTLCVYLTVINERKHAILSTTVTTVGPQRRVKRGKKSFVSQIHRWRVSPGLRFCLVRRLGARRVSAEAPPRQFVVTGGGAAPGLVAIHGDTSVVGNAVIYEREGARSPVCVAAEREFWEQFLCGDGARDGRDYRSDHGRRFVDYHGCC